MRSQTEVLSHNTMKNITKTPKPMFEMDNRKLIQIALKSESQKINTCIHRISIRAPNFVDFILYIVNWWRLVFSGGNEKFCMQIVRRVMLNLQNFFFTDILQNTHINGAYYNKIFPWGPLPMCLTCRISVQNSLYTSHFPS